MAGAFVISAAACGGGSDFKVGDTFETPFGTATVVTGDDEDFLSLSFPDCNKLVEAVGVNLAAFDPVEDAGVPPPPDGYPSDTWRWVCE